MSKSSVQQVIQKAVSDAAFRRQLQREPAKALAGFDLTAEERSSIAGGDPARLTALGVDQRMSKAFALGAAADASTQVNAGSIGDPGTSGSAAFIDEGGAAGTNVQGGLVGDTTSGATSVFASDPTSGATASISADDTTGSTGVTESITSSDGPQLDAGVTGDTTSGATSVIPSDPTVGATSDVDSSGDANLLDAGITGASGASTTFEVGPLTGIYMQDAAAAPADAQVAGTQVTIDDGQPATAFETDGGSATSANDVVFTTDSGDVAPSIDSMPSFDGHVTIDDTGNTLDQ
jgi:hypothetical protein